MRRIFIAVKVDPGENLKRMISFFKRSLTGENIKWVEPGNFHITLAFPGNTEEDKIKIVSNLVEENCTGFGEFEFSLTGTGVFKNVREPRVIWAGVQPSDDLKKLDELVTTGVRSSGIAVEDRLFRPHLTLGRLKALKSDTELKTLLVKYHDVEIQKVPVHNVIIYESILKPEGPIYNPVRIIKLA